MIFHTLILIGIVSLMFWQPQFGGGHQSRPPYRPSNKQRYIDRICDQIRAGQYESAIALIENSKYPKSDLPVEYLQDSVLRERERLQETVLRLETIDSLEERLEGL